MEPPNNSTPQTSRLPHIDPGSTNAVVTPTLTPPTTPIVIPNQGSTSQSNLENSTIISIPPSESKRGLFLKIAKVAFPLLAAIACFAAVAFTGGTAGTFGLLVAGVALIGIAAYNTHTDTFAYFRSANPAEKNAKT